MAHFSQQCRSYTEAKGEGQRAHMVKNLVEGVCGGGADERDRLPILLGRPASPKEMPDLINHVLQSMRSLKLLDLDATVLVSYRKPPLYSLSQWLLFGPHDSHVAVEVMVGGHRKGPMKFAEFKPRGWKRDTGVVPCALLKLCGGCHAV